MAQIGIITDSFACLDYLSYPYPITILRATLTIENERYLDHADLTLNDFYAYLKKNPNRFPTTQQPSYQSIIDTLEAFLERQYDTVIIITLSSHLSQFYANALLASQAFKDSMNVIVFDSAAVGYPQAKMALTAAHLISSGAEVGTIYRSLETMRKHQHMFFAVETLDYLKQHGRLSNAKGYMGNVLKVKPILGMTPSGQMLVIEKVRTFSRAIDRLIEVYAEYVHQRTVEPFIMHANNASVADYIEARLKALDPTLRKIFITPVTPALAAHVGPGAVALGYLDYPKDLLKGI